ncbi:MAG: recombinase RecT [Candidatus Bathyarchaeota archaeon]|nr:recombinase RecT [Candidatus Bathyarchaeota archaeon]
MVSKEIQKTNTSDLKKSLKEEPKKSGFVDLLKSMEHEIRKALPKHITVERMMRIAQTAYSRNPKLAECDPRTIIAGVVQASQMGLEIDTPLGHSYLIPFKNNKTGKMEAQFQTGYRGELSLAYRTREYKVIGAYSVYKNDEFHYELGLEQRLKHIPAKAPEGEPIFYYAIYKTISGGEGFEVMSREQVTKHANQYSMAFQKGWSSPWKSDFDAMAKKTVLKRLLSYAPKSIEYEKVFSQDGSIKREIAEDMTTVKSEIDWDSLQMADE